MSNNNNTELLERAGEMLEYWTGTLHERLIDRAIKDNDLEALAYHVRNAEAEMRLQEDYEQEMFGSEEQVTRAESIRDGMREDGIL